MTKGWEYLSLALTREVEKKTKVEDASDLPLSPEEPGYWSYSDIPEETEYWSYSDRFSIWRPGAKEAEERQGFSTEVEGSRSSALEILNELGGEGWEIIEYTIKRTAITERSNLGWSTAGFPIETSWLMKREITS